MMNMYYVVECKGDEFDCGKFGDPKEAIKQARSEWNRLTESEKKSTKIEVRLYEDDIESEDCTNFDYDVIEWGYIIRDSEAGNEIERVKTVKEAESLLWDYVKKDQEDEEKSEEELLSFYEVIDTITGEVMDLSWNYSNDEPELI